MTWCQSSTWLLIHLVAGMFLVSLGKTYSGSGSKRHAGFICAADVCGGEQFPQDTLAPVCEGVDDLMKTSHFVCQIIWHPFSAPAVSDSGVGGTRLVSSSLWLTVWSCEHDSEGKYLPPHCFDRALTCSSLALQVPCMLRSCGETI